MKNHTYKIVAISIMFLFTSVPFAQALIIVKTEDTGQINSGAGVRVDQETSIEGDVGANGERMEDGVNTTVGIRSEEDNDHGAGTLRAKEVADENGREGIEKAELHIDLAGTQEDESDIEVDDVSKVLSLDDFQGFVRFTAKKDTHLKSVDAKEGSVDIEYEEPAKLFGFINTTINAHVSVDMNENVKVAYPWYHIFMKKHISRASLQSKIAQAIAAERKGEQESIASSTIQTTIAAAFGIPNIFEIVVRTLKDASLKVDSTAEVQR